MCENREGQMSWVGTVALREGDELPWGMFLDVQEK